MKKFISIFLISVFILGVSVGLVGCDDPVISINLKGSLTTNYYVGDAFDASGVSVVARTQSGAKHEVSLADSKVSISGFDTSSEGLNKTCTVAYSGKKYVFLYNVSLREIYGVSLEPQSYTYDGNAKFYSIPDIDGLSSSLTFAQSYSSTGVGTGIVNAGSAFNGVVNAGTYKLNLTMHMSGYKTETREVELTITQKQVNVQYIFVAGSVNEESVAQMSGWLSPNDSAWENIAYLPNGQIYARINPEDASTSDAANNIKLVQSINPAEKEGIFDDGIYIRGSITSVNGSYINKYVFVSTSGNGNYKLNESSKRLEFNVVKANSSANGLYSFNGQYKSLATIVNEKTAFETDATLSYNGTYTLSTMPSTFIDPNTGASLSSASFSVNYFKNNDNSVTVIAEWGFINYTSVTLERTFAESEITA